MYDIPPQTPAASGAVILLHGWGANGQDLIPLAESIGIPSLHYFFPEAMFEVPGTGGFGKGWFTFPPNEHSHTERLNSLKQISSIIDKISSNGIPAKKIILLGFSQGASMSLEAMLTYKDKLGAVVSLSGFLIDSEKFGVQDNLPTDIPIFAAHGTYDPILPLEISKPTIMKLREVGFDVEWHEYPMVHEIMPEEIGNVRRFIEKVLPPQSTL